MLKLGYKELYLDLDSDYQYPIEDFASSIPKLIGTSRDVIHLNFSGIDELTDEVFFVLKSELKSAQKENVETIDLTGCCFITDRGIEVMAQSFPNLKELILIGCTQITHLSLDNLLELCHKLDKLVAQFTGISYLSHKAIERWGFENIHINPLFKYNDQEAKIPVNLIIIGLDPNFKYDIPNLLITGKLTERSDRKAIKITPYAWKIDDTDINFIELYCHSTYMAPFLQERSIYIIGMDMESVTANSFNIIKQLDFIRAVTYSAPIELVAIDESGDKSALTNLSDVLKSIFKDQSENMKEHLEQEHYTKSIDKDFIDQWRYIQSLASIDPERISLHLLGLDKSSLSYCSTICEPSTVGKMEQIKVDFIPIFQNVKDSIDRITKGDISEIRSLANLPPDLNNILQSVLKVLKKPISIQKFLSDSMLLKPFLDIDFILNDDDVDDCLETLKETFDTKEKLEKIARKGYPLANAFGMWLLAKWKISEEIAPLKKKAIDYEQGYRQRNSRASPHELIQLNLHQDLLQLNKYMYKHSPTRYTDAMRVVMNAVEKLNSANKSQNKLLIKLSDLSNEIGDLLTVDEIIQTLKKIQLSFQLWIHGFSNNEYLIIYNINLFVDIFNALLNDWTEPSNGNQVWSISSKCILGSEKEVRALLNFIESDEEYEWVMSILKDLGIIITVRPSWNKNPVHWVSSTEDGRTVNKLYISSHQLTLRPQFEGDSFRNPNDQSNRDIEANVLKDIFPGPSSSKYSKDDLAFKFSFKFRTGIPCNLFCQIANQIVFNHHTVLFWSQGVLLYSGAANVLVTHNIHASRGSSSFELEARIRKPIEGRRAVAVREHLWHLLSDIFTIIEGNILQYPYLHHKLRHYCRGQCFLEFGQENTFSQAQISRSLQCNYFCSKCREYQMSQAEWLYVLGRQLLLPNHDYDNNTKNSCKSCWLPKEMIKKLWKLQCKAYPVFAELVFAETDNNDCIHGNVITEPQTTTHIYSDTKCSYNQLRSLSFLIVNKRQSIVRLVSRLSSGAEEEVFLWQLDTGIVSTDLECQEREIFDNKLLVKNGDSIQFSFKTSAKSYSMTVVIISINKKYQISLFFKSSLSVYMALKFDPAHEEAVQTPTLSNTIRMIITQINAARVSALHFRPGMIVLLKTETRWEPAVVYNIIKGKLQCVPLGTIDNKNRRGSLITHVPSSYIHEVSLDSDGILPPAFYPSDINSTLDSKNQKSLADNWYRIFAEHPEYSPAPFGLFPRLLNNSNYEPLSILGIDDRECISSTYAPTRLLRLMYLERSFSSRMNTSYIPLPHPMTPEKLLLPHRNIINSYKNQALHRLCPGNKWRNYLADLHPMDEQPCELTEGEARYIWNGPRGTDLFIIIKNFGTNHSALYQNIDNSFPNLNPEINKDMLRDAIVALSKTYRDIYLFDIVARIKMYDRGILLLDNTDFNTKSKKNTKQNQKNNRQSNTDSAKGRQNKAEISVELTTKIDNSNSHWTDKESNRIISLFKQHQVLCESHSLANDILRLSDLGRYCQCIVNVTISNQKINDVTDTALVTCSRLSRLDVDCVEMPNTQWLRLLPPLVCLTLKNCGIRQLGPEIELLAASIKQLSIESNPIEELPDFICTFIHLDNLSMSNTLISELPHNFGKLNRLRYLEINHTRITSLPESFRNLKNLTTLKFQGVATPSILYSKKNKLITKQAWIKTICNKVDLNGWVYNNEEVHNLIDEFLKNETNLPSSEIENLSDRLYNYFPRLTTFPPQIFDCINLQSLILPYHAFPTVPDDVKQLIRLKNAIFEGNRHLESLSGYLGKCPLSVLSCANCDNLKTPPLEVRRRGMRNTIAYLLRLVSGSEAFYRTKLMLVGLGGAGKTSLMRALMSKDYRAPHLSQEAITDGIDIAVWSTKRLGDNTPIEFSVWDFAGQTLYYNTHQFFITERAIYLLMWNVRQGYEHAGLDFWLNSISCHAPKAPIFIVGTHADKVDKSEIPTNVFSERYPSIAGFHFVSSLNGLGIKELHDHILQVTRQQSYMGEIVPNIWLRFEKSLISKRSTADYLTWSQVKEIAINNAIYEGEINQAIRFLHDLGSIQYFEIPLLKDYVIINSQWLVDVMACVVSVKNTLIQYGKLAHDDIEKVWRKYPKAIHTWLLRLTEIFDLTFSVPNCSFNYVPCLLPNEAPEFHWPTFVESSQIRESNMFYQFEYLPPGLFNRAQVRLSQYSDSFTIWQHGSLLQKNEDKALMTKLNDRTVKICARGYWPDNIMFIIHEVYETLISEAFSGVQYQYQLSCRKCLAEKDPEPHLFSKDILQRAARSKTAFIQCHKNFHILLMQEIQESMPPDSLEDYDLQFKKSMQFISSNQEQLHNMVMVLCDRDDYENDTDILNTTKRIIKDLQNQYSLSFEPISDGAPQDIFIDLITRSEVVVTIISKNFIANKTCMELFKIARNTLRKNMCFVIIDKEFKEESLGYEVAGEKYINFERSNVYDHKIKQLINDIEQFSGDHSVKKIDETKPRVFVSYCWDNSKRAFDCGNSKFLKKNAVGWGDPRDIKDYLEQKGIRCWLDVDMAVTSLYSDIAEGLKNSELFVACLSNEYAASDICRKEFMFAKQNLNLPIIIAEMGCTQEWKKSEIGMLSIEYNLFSFQKEDMSAFEMLYKQVDSLLPLVAENVSSESAKSESSRKKLALQEDFELIQRKIYRLLSSGFGSEEARVYPCLFFVDILSIDDYPNSDQSDDEDDDDHYRPLHSDTGLPPFSLCFRVLCESETGWHTVDDGLPIYLGYTELIEFLGLSAPYLFRITQLLKLCDNYGQIKLFDSSINQNVVKYIFENLEKFAKSWSYVKPIHKTLRNHIMERDHDRKYGGLKICCLNNGKLTWLCKDHQNQSHISVLDMDESESLLKLTKQVKDNLENSIGKNTMVYGNNNDGDNSDDDDNNEGEGGNENEGINKLSLRPISTRHTNNDIAILRELQALHKDVVSDTDSSLGFFNKKFPVQNETNKMVGQNMSPMEMEHTIEEDELGSSRKNNQSRPRLLSVIPNDNVVPALELFNPLMPANKSKVCQIM